MTLAPFQGVVFDCDGVLFNSETLGLRSLQQALREQGVAHSIESLTRFSGRSHSETLTQLAAESGVALEVGAVARRMDEVYVEFVRAEGLALCLGVPEMLSWLTASHIPFTLASSGPRRKVMFSLRSAGIGERFPRFFCGDDVVRAKPAPDLYLAAAAHIGMLPGQCLVIEDAPNGIQSARAAGMQVVGVTTTFSRNFLEDADLVVDSLLSLVAELSRPGR